MRRFPGRRTSRPRPAEIVVPPIAKALQTLRDSIDQQAVGFSVNGNGWEHALPNGSPVYLARHPDGLYKLGVNVEADQSGEHVHAIVFDGDELVLRHATTMSRGSLDSWKSNGETLFVSHDDPIASLVINQALGYLAPHEAGS